MLSRVLLISFLAIAFANTGNTCSLSPEPTAKECSFERAAVVEQVKVDLKILKVLPHKREFEIVVRNVGTQPVLVMTDPVRANGSKGPYISLAEEDPRTLEIGIKLYSPPPYFLIANDARVRLEKLEVGASHREIFEVSFPLSETMPPYGDKLTRRKIDPEQLQSIRVSVGVLPDDDGVRDLLGRKPLGPFLNGSEGLLSGNSKGKRIIELQSVHTSPDIRYQ